MSDLGRTTRVQEPVTDPTRDLTAMLHIMFLLRALTPYHWICITDDHLARTKLSTGGLHRQIPPPLFAMSNKTYDSLYHALSALLPRVTCSIKTTHSSLALAFPLKINLTWKDCKPGRTKERWMDCHLALPSMNRSRPRHLGTNM